MTKTPDVSVSSSMPTTSNPKGTSSEVFRDEGVEEDDDSSCHPVTIILDQHDMTAGGGGGGGVAERNQQLEMMIEENLTSLDLTQLLVLKFGLEDDLAWSLFLRLKVASDHHHPSVESLTLERLVEDNEEIVGIICKYPSHHPVIVMKKSHGKYDFFSKLSNYFDFGMIDFTTNPTSRASPSSRTGNQDVDSDQFHEIQLNRHLMMEDRLGLTFTSPVKVFPMSTSCQGSSSSSSCTSFSGKSFIAQLKGRNLVLSRVDTRETIDVNVESDFESFDVVKSTSETENMFVLMSSTEQFVVTCRSHSQKSSWMSATRLTRTGLKMLRKYLKKIRSNPYAPYFVCHPTLASSSTAIIYPNSLLLRRLSIGSKSPNPDEQQLNPPEIPGILDHVKEGGSSSCMSSPSSCCGGIHVSSPSKSSAMTTKCKMSLVDRRTGNFDVLAHKPRARTDSNTTTGSLDEIESELESSSRHEASEGEEVDGPNSSCTCTERSSRRGSLGSTSGRSSRHQFINRHSMETTSVEPEVPWFYENMSREEASSLLAKYSTINGVFLVRTSTRTPGQLVLSFSSNGKIVHAQIIRIEVDNTTCLTIDSGQTRFYDLKQLIEFHQLNLSPFLGCKLTHYVVHFRPQPGSVGKGPSSRRLSTPTGTFN